MPRFDLEDLRARGFGGFVTVASLTRPEPFELPVASGVYVVTRASDAHPIFLSRSGAGRWKKRDPSVPIDRLQREWLGGA